MSDETSDLDEMLGFLGEDRHRPDPEEHPDPETLTAYQANELSPEEDEQIQDHLAVCRHCAELLLDLEEFLQPPEAGASDASDFEAAADWRRLRGVVAASGTGRRWSSPRAAYSLAAVLAVALIGVSLYAGSLRRELRQPVAEEESESLPAQGSQRSALPEPQPIRLPTTLVLEVSSTRTFREYQADFENENGKVVQSVKGSIHEDSMVRIFMPRHGLERGRYQVTLWGLQGEVREKLGTYDVRIMI